MIKWIICWLLDKPLFGISGHDYYLVSDDVLKCRRCGWYSWDGGEGKKLPKICKKD